MDRVISVNAISSLDDAVSSVKYSLLSREEVEAAQQLGHYDGLTRSAEHALQFICVAEGYAKVIEKERIEFDIPSGEKHPVLVNLYLTDMVSAPVIFAVMKAVYHLQMQIRFWYWNPALKQYIHI